MRTEIEDFFEGLHLHIRYVRQAGEIIGGIPDELLYTHDASKFTSAEAEHYARQFHGDKGDPNGFALAWLNHIRHNPHHWQYWLFPNGYAPKGSLSEAGAMPMPEVYTREMVADWMGASFAYTGSWDMSDWLNENFVNGKVILHSKTRHMVYGILFSIGYVNWDNSPLVALLDRSKYPEGAR